MDELYVLLLLKINPNNGRYNFEGYDCQAK